MLDHNMLPPASASSATLAALRSIDDTAVRLQCGLHQLGDCLGPRAARVLLHDGRTGLSHDAGCYSAFHTATNATSDTAAAATDTAAAASSDATFGTSGPVQLRCRGVPYLAVRQEGLVLPQPSHLRSANIASTSSRPV